MKIFYKFIFFLIIISFISISALSNVYKYNINIDTRYQEIYGFGASAAWYQNWIVEHPNKDEIYDVMFKELGIDILRLQNWYGKNSQAVNDQDPEIVKGANKSLGYPIKILMTSWAPPATLKSNNSTKNGGTLKKENNQYVYDQFADYWYESLMAYKKVGVVPDYISIQNEPDYIAEWESNILDPVENEKNAGYDKTFNAIYNKLHDNMDNPPKLLGPETLGIANKTVLEYASAINLDQLYGIAFHLYSGGDHANPTQYNHNLNLIRDEFKDKPIFQTEFERGTAFEAAWQMYTALVEGDVNAYLYWELFWEDKGLVSLEYPWDSNRWTTEKGYYKTDMYYSVQHYSKFIEPGFQRVDVDEGNRRVKMSAFISPDENELVVVFLNTFLQDNTIQIEIPDFNFSETETYQTIFVDGENKFKNIGACPEDNRIIIPRRSLITVRFIK